MKKIYVVLFAAIALVVLRAETMSDDGRAGATGAPGESACNASGCHVTFPLNSGPGFIRVASNMNNFEYRPDSVYTFNVTVGQSTRTLFGVGVGILTSTGQNAGTLIITQPTKTLIKTRTINGVVRNNVVHQLNGGIGTDSAVFTFNWRAPATDIGPVTLYAAGNASNRNGNVSGDYIYTTSQVINPLNTTSVSNIETSHSVSVFPNPVKDNFRVSSDNITNGRVKISLLNLNGGLISVLSDENQQGELNKDLILPDNISSGIYLLSVESEMNTALKKIVVNR